MQANRHICPRTAQAMPRTGGEWLEWGEVFASDGRIDHETLKLGKGPRLIPMADFAAA
ncbi:MAG: hypothetical protein Fur0037_22120 [Planctomycetota bacterium]